MKIFGVILMAISLWAAGTALAEDNEDLVQASYQGTLSGNAEHDTFGFGSDASSDLYFRSSYACDNGSSCLGVGTAAGPTGQSSGEASYHGPMTGNPEQDTYGY